MSNEHTIPARAFREAQFGFNDIWPNDPVVVNTKSLAQEAAMLALKRLNAMLEEQIRAAFESGQDYVLSEFGVVPEDVWAAAPKFSIDVAFKGRPSTPGEFENGLPIGWRLFRVQDWIEGKMK